MKGSVLKKINTIFALDLHDTAYRKYNFEK